MPERYASCGSWSLDYRPPRLKVRCYALWVEPRPVWLFQRCPPAHGHGMSGAGCQGPGGRGSAVRGPGLFGCALAVCAGLAPAPHSRTIPPSL